MLLFVAMGFGVAELASLDKLRRANVSAVSLPGQINSNRFKNKLKVVSLSAIYRYLADDTYQLDAIQRRSRP